MALVKKKRMEIRLAVLIKYRTIVIRMMHLLSMIMEMMKSSLMMLRKIWV